MRVRIIGDGECARATRGLLRKAGFAVTDYLPGEAVPGAPVYGPLFGYAIQIEESADRRTEHIHFDSVDCELEANILKHVTALSKHPVMVDRPGGVVHSDREIRIVVPAHLPGQQIAVEFGVMRGLVDTVGQVVPTLPRSEPWYRRIFRRSARGGSPATASGRGA